jgi:hypothetical protein
VIWSWEQGELFSKPTLKHPSLIYSIRKVEIHYHQDHISGREELLLPDGIVFNLELTISRLIILETLGPETNLIE